jgi:outer membrane protein TolC
MRKTVLFSVFTLFILGVTPASATSFDEYVQRLAEHPQVGSILAESDALRAQAQGELGLPDPTLSFGVDNVPVSDPAFDRFLPTSKVIGFNQKIPNPILLGAKAKKLNQLSHKQALMADYTKSRLSFMLITKLAQYESIKQQQRLIKKQFSYYQQLENTFKGQIESGRSVYQRFSEVDVERAEAQRKLNNLTAQKSAIEAEFIRLVGNVPDFKVDEVQTASWGNNPNALYPVLLAAENVDIARKDIGIANANFLPNFGVNAIYKQRESGRNNSFSGDDWFSVQAQITIPLWASTNQKPKLKAARDKERSAIFSYDDVSSQWVSNMKSIESARDAASKNIKVLQDKDHAMRGKVKAVQRNYEAGTEDLSAVLLSKIDRLNIQAQLVEVQATYLSKIAEFNSNIKVETPTVIKTTSPDKKMETKK